MTQTPTTPAEPDENGEPTAVSVAEEAVVDEGSGLEARDDEAAVDEAPAGGTRAADAAVAAPVTDDTALADEVAAPTEEPVAQESSDVEPDAAVVAETEPAVEGSSDVEAEVAVEAEVVAMAEVAVSVADGPAAAESVVPVTDESPAPAPGPRPSPASLAARAVPRPPSGPRPAPEAPAAATAPVVVAAPVAALDPVEAAAAAAFGRVTEDGTVFVTDGEEEREVGQVPGATSDDALTLYVRRFLDLRAKVVLFESRLAATDLSIKEIDGTLDRLTEELAAPAAVGDLVGLRARLDGLREVAAVRRAAAEAERAAARAAALEARTAIVEEAEQISGTDPTKIQWRPAGERLRQLLDQWKEAQRSGPRLDRPSEEALWKRFSHARTTFDRERRHFFAELESRNSAAKATKEALVDQAERLATSSDWAGTASAFRDLMAQWKLAGRASRPVDDALWARFRAAQDAFFGARDAAAAATDEEFQANAGPGCGCSIRRGRQTPRPVTH